MSDNKSATETKSSVEKESTQALEETTNVATNDSSAPLVTGNAKEDTESRQPSASVAEAPIAAPPSTQTANPVDPFANEEGAAIHYKTMDWWHAGILMIAETISLGVLSLPQAVANLGLVPGLLAIFLLGITATYTGFVIGQYKVAHPHITSFADAGMQLCGPIGREVFAVAQVLLLVFIQAAHILSFSIAMNTLTGHATCSVVWCVVGMLISFVLTLPRKLQSISYLSVLSCISVLIAVTLTMGAIGVTKPDMGRVAAVGAETELALIIAPILNIILAYAGHVAFFGFIAELKQPSDFPKALCMLQISCTTFYMLIAAVIYYYAGDKVASPALGSAPLLISKISWGIAMPTIIVAGVVNGHVACKYIYVRYWTGTSMIHQNNFKSLGSWTLITFGSWLIAWIIAEAVPNFNLLLGLISTLFCCWFSYGFTGLFWLQMNKGQWFATWKKCCLFVINCGVVLLGTTICVLGLYSSGVRLRDGKGGKPFAC